MQKAELRKLRRLNATKEMMQKAKYKITVHDRYKDEDTQIYEYEAFIRIQNLGAYIKIAVFDPSWMRANCTGAKFEVFLNIEGQEYITRELDQEGNEVKWLTAMIYNLLEKNELKHYWQWRYDCEQKIFANADAMKTLARIPVEHERGYKGIKRLQQWQQAIKDEETKRREKAEQQPWDEDMAKIPALPKNLNVWARKNVLKEHFIFYEYSPKKTTTGWCTNCRTEVTVQEPRYNKTAKCPHCRAKIIYKSTGKIKTLYAEGYSANIIQKIDGGIVERTFTYSESYRGDPRHPQENVYEYSRKLLVDDEVKTYYWQPYKNKHLRWCLDETTSVADAGYHYGWYKDTILYKGNLKKIDSPLLKHSSYMLWNKPPTRLMAYVILEKRYPVIERLAKVGLFNIARELIRTGNKENLRSFSERSSLPEGLGLDKFRLKRLRNMNGNMIALRWLQLEKKNNEIIPNEIIQRLSEEGISSNDISFALKRLSLVKTYNYITKQSKEMDETLSQTVTTWRDYLNMAKRAKINIEADQLFKPKNLKLEHDKLVLDSLKGEHKKLVKELEKKWPKVNSKMPKLKKFEFAADGYQIIAPNGIEDIVTEGLCLRHCVHNVDYYYDRIQRDESYIFFLRKAANPDFPWYTLEVEPSGNIRQKRTTGDKQNDDFQNAVAFLKKWQKYFTKQLTKEEKKLGIIADKLRKENYKQLREDRKKVWHGKYAGQLLADVLEADFMEAI